MTLLPVEQAMDAAVGTVFPGAVLLVRNGDQEPYVRAFGHRMIEPERSLMREDTVFDLSSLTKPLATAVAMMLLVRDGKIRLDDRVVRFFPNFGVHGKTAVTFRHLLAHSSGLPAWRPFYKKIVQIERKGGRPNFIATRGARDYVIEEIERARPEQGPGRRAVYSDLGFMLLGAVVEMASGAPLDRVCEERIFRPLSLPSMTFVDLTRRSARRLAPDSVAATEHCPWRKKVLCGEVHDDNAYAMGGVAGHAGLFGNARDVDALLCELVRCYEGRGRLVPASIAREFWTRDASVPGSTWALGFDSPSPAGSMAGSLFSRNTLGHLGFTGVSFWCDLERHRHVVLLTNRVHPRRDNEAIRTFRPMIHDLINGNL